MDTIIEQWRLEMNKKYHDQVIISTEDSDSPRGLFHISWRHDDAHEYFRIAVFSADEFVLMMVDDTVYLDAEFIIDLAKLIQHIRLACK